MGSFQDAIQLAAVNGGPADIAAVRRYQSRGGISMNLEQQLIPNVGLFVRAGVADGSKEPYEFTDVDRTVAAGLSISGKQWGRDNDTFGIAGVVNGISGVHQAFLNAGGLGILVGDGKACHIQGIPCGLGHHASTPVEGGFHGQVVAPVAVITFTRVFKVARLARL